MSIRQPAVAGSFYAADETRLKQDVLNCLGDSSPGSGMPKAVIVPHAGYCYSGAVAGKAFSLLNDKAKINRVVILGPNHRVALNGLAISRHDVFNTPLGNMKIDTELANTLLEQGVVANNESAHQYEHSLEVQLPFIRMCLPGCKVLPVVVGSNAKQSVVRLLEMADSPDTLFVISTDLSHFHSYQQAQLLDQDTITKMSAFADDLTGEQACGSNVLNGFLVYCQRKHWRMQLLDYKNSGDTGGDKSSVVGYASFSLYES